MRSRIRVAAVSLAPFLTMALMIVVQNAKRWS
jgi:hypothetical protein